MTIVGRHASFGSHFRLRHFPRAIVVGRMSHKVASAVSYRCSNSYKGCPGSLVTVDPLTAKLSLPLPALDKVDAR
jgi:hypothetical protein